MASVVSLGLRLRLPGSQSKCPDAIETVHPHRRTLRRFPRSCVRSFVPERQFQRPSVEVGVSKPRLASINFNIWDRFSVQYTFCVPTTISLRADESPFVILDDADWSTTRYPPGFVHAVMCCPRRMVPPQPCPLLCTIIEEPCWPHSPNYPGPQGFGQWQGASMMGPPDETRTRGPRV